MPAASSADELSPLWRQVTEALRASVPASTYKLWLAPLRPVSADADTLYLTAPESVRRWVERRYAASLLATVRRVAPAIATVSFLAADEAPSGAPAAAAPPEPPLNPDHTFERFVIGPGNRLAHAAALAVAEAPGEAYNPLFLHGPSGLGKTHLMGAIAAYLRRSRPDLTVRYTTAERFTAEFVTALRHDGPDTFKGRYRELDALLIDDVQVLEGKLRTEEEFVHTFNALHAAGKQVVLCADRSPEALSQLAERLRDRFRWGLCAELGQPDARTRIALLWRFASDSSIPLAEPAVLREIAALVPENVRVLEGALTRVAAIGSMLSEPLTQPLVQRALGQGSPPRAAESGAPPPSLEAIQDAVAAALGVRREELLSASRTPRVAQARQLAMYLARQLTGMSLGAIARAFDRDHTTVIHALRAVEKRLGPDTPTTEALHRVRSALHE